MWSRRTAITLQVSWGPETDTGVLTSTIVPELDEEEFFVRKAVGWALRDYSRTDPHWVRAFLEEHAVTGPAAREASRHL